MLCAVPAPSLLGGSYDSERAGNQPTVTAPEPHSLALNVCFFQGIVLWSALSCWGFADLTDVRPSGGPVIQAGSRVSGGQWPGEVIRPKLCSEHPHGEKGFRKCAPCSVENPELGGRGCSKQWSGTPPGGPPDPYPRPGIWAARAGRRSGSRLGRTESSFMHVFTKKGKKYECQLHDETQALSA